MSPLITNVCPVGKYLKKKLLVVDILLMTERKNPEFFTPTFYCIFECTLGSAISSFLLKSLALVKHPPTCHQHESKNVCPVSV